MATKKTTKKAAAKAAPDYVPDAKIDTLDNILTIEFEDLAKYDGGAVRTLLSIEPNGSHVLELFDGQIVRVLAVPAVVRHHPENSLAHLKEMLAKLQAGLPERIYSISSLVADDPRMGEFWRWLETVKRKKHSISAWLVASEIARCTSLPGKPGNMTPANRKDYFEKIRKHAQELQLLLQQTRFCNDYGDDERELTEKELNKKLSERLYDWADDEADEGHIVAFRVTIDGVFEQHYTYPDNALFSTLSGLVEWTYWDDNWDGNIFKSSLPIAQANSASAAIVFFTCSLHDYFSKDGIEIPFAILATVANVALKLDFDSQVDEDAVRKQVRRYQQRTAKDKKPGRLNAFDDTGQNCWDSDNSVLSEPF